MTFFKTKTANIENIISNYIPLFSNHWVCMLEFLVDLLSIHPNFPFGQFGPVSLAHYQKKARQSRGLVKRRLTLPNSFFTHLLNTESLWRSYGRTITDKNQNAGATGGRGCPEGDRRAMRWEEDKEVSGGQRLQGYRWRLCLGLWGRSLGQDLSRCSSQGEESMASAWFSSISYLPIRYLSISLYLNPNKLSPFLDELITIFTISLWARSLV